MDVYTGGAWGVGLERRRRACMECSGGGEQCRLGGGGLEGFMERSLGEGKVHVGQGGPRLGEEMDV